MKKTILLVPAFFCALFISGCMGNESQNTQEAIISPTGYWFFSEDGQRIWRTVTPKNARPVIKPAVRNHHSSFGNGSGR